MEELPTDSGGDMTHTQQYPQTPRDVLARAADAGRDAASRSEALRQRILRDRRAAREHLAELERLRRSALEEIEALRAIKASLLGALDEHIAGLHAAWESIEASLAAVTRDLPVEVAGLPEPVAGEGPHGINLTVHGYMSVPTIVRFEQAVRSLPSVEQLSARHIEPGRLRITLLTTALEQELLRSLVEMEQFQLRPVGVRRGEVELESSTSPDLSSSSSFASSARRP